MASLRKAVQLSYADYRDALDAIVSTVLRVSSGLTPRPDEIAGRIYGGWFQTEPSRTTEAKDILEAVVRRNFPTRRPIRIRMAVADSLLVLPEEILAATLRVIPGIPYFQTVGSTTGCASPSSCTLPALRDWVWGRCPHPGCPVRSQDVCRRLNQKLVDTAMCCDMIAIAQTRRQDWILVLSDDDDLVPGLLMASKHSGKLARLRRSRHATRHYDAVLENQKVLLVEV